MERTKIGDAEAEVGGGGVLSRSWRAISRPSENWGGGWGAGVVGVGWDESIGE